MPFTSSSVTGRRQARLAKSESEVRAHASPPLARSHETMRERRVELASVWVTRVSAALL
jgi:hypothetical protein